MEENSLIPIENIKQEEAVEFVLILPTSQATKRFIGDIKLEECSSDSEDQVKLRVNSIQDSRKRSGTFICDLCGKNIKWKSRLLEHLFCHIKPFKCECGRSFGSKRKLNQHISTHDEDRTRFSSEDREKTRHIKPFKCDCGKSFDSKPDLNKHKPTHDKDRKRFKCIFCSSTSYSSKGALNYHIKTHHFTIGEKFKCDECEYEGKTKNHLRDHLRVHQKPFKCNKCDKRFSVNQIMKRHLKKHEEPDEFVCLCSRVFKSAKSLSQHKTMMHKPGQPIEIDDGTCTCNFCNKIFSSKKDLKNHMKTHEEKKKCPICFEMFAVLSLKKHVRRHQLKEGEKEFKCEKCSKAFLTSQYLKDHMKRHDKQFECDVCGHRVARKDEIKNHIKRHVNRH